MTREEAIRELKADYCGNRIICELYPDQCNREDCEIWWAINALENVENGNSTPESAQNVPNQAFKMQKSDVWGDKISRQAAIDAVNNIMPTKEGFYEPSEVFCELMQLPSAQPEPKWIPCKKRLPDKDGLYLVTYFSGHARWTGTDELLVDGTGKLYWKYANVVAWQPKPEPYREGGDYA